MDDDQSDAGIATTANLPEGPPAFPVAAGIDPYWRSISLQAAARAARFAEASARPGGRWASKAFHADEIEQEGRRSLMLGFVVGAALYAGIMSFFVDMLRSPLSPATTTLPPPGAPAAESPLHRQLGER